jgi:hypothetical protein
MSVPRNAVKCKLKKIILKFLFYFKEVNNYLKLKNGKKIIIYNSAKNLRIRRRGSGK